MCRNISNIDYDKLAERMYNLYVSKKYPFIKQKSDGTYEWVYNLGDLKSNKYEILKRHLQSKQTIGVLCHTHSKFICFDCDFGMDKENCGLTKWITYKIINVLQEFGIDQEYINVALSGNKGYHILLFFDDIISFKQMEFLYDLVLESIYYTIDYDTLSIIHSNWKYTLEQLKSKIELRPKPNLGVKLELSIHQVTKNKCYFCDTNNLIPIKSIEYLYQIKQFPRNQLIDIINKGKEFRHDRENINNFNKEIKNKVQPAKSQQLYVNKEYTINYIEKLITNGLTISGTRHNSLMKIARYNYSMGLDEKDNENFLINWMNDQNKQYYNSNELEWRKDIKYILKFVYNNCRGLTGSVRDISINKEEMYEILKCKEKSKKLLFFALIIHSKRYSIKNGEFYMSYQTLKESAHIGTDSIHKYLKQLQDENNIKIIRQGKKDKNTKYYLVNKYKITNTKINCNNMEKKYTIVCTKNNLNDEYNNCMINLFDKKELKKLIPDKQYRVLSKMYA